MNQRSNCKHPLDHSKSKRIPEKNSISASLTMLECLIEWTTTNCSVQCSCLVVSDTFQPMDSSTPGLPDNTNFWSCPLSRWYHPTISSSVIPFSSHLQTFSASGSFQMSQFFTSGGQTIGVSASTSVLPKNIQYWFPLGWTGWVSLQSKGLSRGFSNTKLQEGQSSMLNFLYAPTLTSIHNYW